MANSFHHHHHHSNRHHQLPFEQDPESVTGGGAGGDISPDPSVTPPHMHGPPIGHQMAGDMMSASTHDLEGK